MNSPPDPPAASAQEQDGAAVLMLEVAHAAPALDAPAAPLDPALARAPEVTAGRAPARAGEAPGEDVGALARIAGLEQALARLTAELEHARADADAFSYSISHEIREPLRAIQGLARVFREDHGGALPGDAAALLRRMEAAGERAEALVKSVLEYTRLGRQTLGLQAVPVRRALDEALAHVGADLAARGAACDVVEPLPEVSAHRPTLAQVLANLLANAAKFVAPGARPEILVRCEARAGWVRIWVCDRGIGLPPDHRDRIFEPFVRLHAADLYPGTGIGLAFVRRALERMGGRVGVEAELGAGSRFWIELREVPR